MSLISFGVARSAAAAIFTLTNGTSIATFNNEFNTGFTSWTINGVDQIGGQDTSTFIRVTDPGNTGILNNFCGSGGQFILLETLGCFDPATVTLSDTNNDTFNDKAVLSYTYFDCLGSCPAKNIFSVDLTYTLGTKSLTQKVAITNLTNATDGTATTLNFDIVNYFNLNVNGSAEDRVIPGSATSGTAVQYDDPNQSIGSVYAQTTTSTTGGNVSPSLTTMSDTPSTLFNSIKNSTNDLTNNVNPLTGDVAQAYQFSADNVAANVGVLTSQQTISILEVPEPSVLLGLGGLGLSLFGRKGIKKVKDLLGYLKA